MSVARLLPTLVLLAGVAACSGTAPAEVDDTAQRCDAMHAEAVAAVVRSRDRFALPGVLVAIEDRTCGRYVAAVGDASTSPEEAMTPAHGMSISGVTSTFTAAAALQLVEDGSLRLDDRLDRWLPDVAYAHDITIRHLLSHRSGLRDVHDHLPEAWQTPRDLLSGVLSQDLLFPPGTRFSYVDTDTLLLGLVVEDVAREPLHDFVRAHFVEPLGVVHMGFAGDEPSPLQRTAHTYDAHGKAITAFDPVLSFATADMVADARDLTTWAQTLSLGLVLKPSTMKLMRSFEACGNAACDGYGLGLASLTLHDAQGNAIAVEAQEGRGDTLAGVYFVPAWGASVVLLANAQATDANAPALRAMLGDVAQTIAARR